MRTQQTFSVLIWANKSKKNKDGLPLYARVTVDGRRTEISLKKAVPENSWDPIASKCSGNSEEVRVINNHIRQTESELFKIYSELQMFDNMVTVDAIKNKYIGFDEVKKSLLEVFDYHNEQIEKLIGIDIVGATYTKFKTIRTKLESYIRHQYNRSDIFLHELNHQFISNFEYYLKTKEHISHNTTMRYIANTKKIIHLSVRNGWLSTNPFVNFKCSMKKVERLVLTMDQLEILKNKKLTIKRIDQVRDLFLFSCYCGLAYSDVMLLTPDNISIGIDKELWIITHRKKTSEAVNVPLLPVAKKILDKYKSDIALQSSGKILPHLSNQKLNSYLKELADICGFSQNLTFHLARHTFATTVTLANGVPIETVSRLLGHADIKTTQIYAKVLQNKLSTDMQMLKQKLSDVKNAQTTQSLTVNQ